jgi:alpha-tubulin suppressor-like RCC1 family protein
VLEEMKTTLSSENLKTFPCHDLGIRNVTVPTRVRGGLENERVVLVQIGNNFAAVLTDLGHVWTFGSSSIGQLGTGDMQSQVMTPQFLEGHISQFRIVQVSCGGVHTIAMTERRRLFSWGCNDTGQLGLGDTDHRWIPMLMAPNVPYSNV